MKLQGPPTGGRAAGGPYAVSSVATGGRAAGGPLRRFIKPPGPRVELVCIGTELLSGRVNTHQAYLSRKLRAIGLTVSREACVPDDPGELEAVLRESLARSETVIVCGGLGPTFDDITREAAACALSRSLVYRPEIYRGILRKFARRRMKVPGSNRRQAFILQGAQVLHNRHGSAPGQFLDLGRHQFSEEAARPRHLSRAREGAGRNVRRFLVLLPGPYSEMAPMFESDVLARLRTSYCRGLHAQALAFRLGRIAESAADAKLSGVLERWKGMAEFTILASAGLVDFYARVWGESRAEAHARAVRLRRETIAAVGAHLVAEGDDSLEAAVGKRLREKGLTLALAESCTGGLLGGRITAVPGSSAYFKGGVLAYSNELKTRLLEVSPATLARRGAVSGPCAREMAEGVRRACGAQVGLSVTGVAGPSGGSKAKPIGTIWIAVAGPGPGSRAEAHLLSGGRESIRERAVNQALLLLLRSMV